MASSTDSAITPGIAVGHVLDFAVTSGLQYTDYGNWSIDQSTAATAPKYVAYGGGKPGVTATAAGSVPTTGTATFNGGASGYVSVNTGTGAGLVSPWFGTSQLTANFASHAVTGTVTGIQAFPIGGGGGSSIGTVNNVNLSGTLTGSALTGTTSVSSTAGTAFNIAGATGTIIGALYGPTGQEIAGTFNALGGPNGATLLGSFGAKQAAVPSDRRLKAAIHYAGRRADGLKLYSWHYTGSGRRFVGPIAQDLLADPRFAGAVFTDHDGFMWVDFAHLGLPFEDVAEMRREGEQAIARQLAAA